MPNNGARATNITEEIWQAAADLLARRLPSRRGAIRLLGVGVSGLETEQPRQGDLFDGQRREKQQKLDEVTDRIQDRFGSTALKRAAAIERTPRTEGHER